jgi:alkylation response protein AidB-like acyl-CoA dehydrogenase
LDVELSLNQAETAFKNELRSWLVANVPPSPLPDPEAVGNLDAQRAWEKRLFEAGYGAMHWPREYGGQGANLFFELIFQDEYVRAGGPKRVNIIGLDLVGPTLIAHGTTEQKLRWLPKILTSEHVWSQGFSEPNAGSDLASLTTTAVRDAGDFIVRGQKIWTSLGRFADWIFCLVRTDPTASRHRGLSFIMIDLRSPGVEVRPILQINGAAGFAEVFFSEVRVPESNLIGEVNDGWRVAMTTLGFERGLTNASPAYYSQTVNDLVALCNVSGRGDDEVLQDRVIASYVRSRVYRHSVMRLITRLDGGDVIGAEASLLKLFWSEMEVEIYETGMEAMAGRAEVKAGATGALDPGRWQSSYWRSRAAKIFSGTNEIQKNVISERLLGLPREPR